MTAACKTCGAPATCGNVNGNWCDSHTPLSDPSVLFPPPMTGASALSTATDELMRAMAAQKPAGITRRDLLAGLALVGYMRDPSEVHENLAVVASGCVRAADALIAALDGSEGSK